LQVSADYKNNVKAPGETGAYARKILDDKMSPGRGRTGNGSLFGPPSDPQKRGAPSAGHDRRRAAGNNRPVGPLQFCLSGELASRYPEYPPGSPQRTHGQNGRAGNENDGDVKCGSMPSTKDKYQFKDSPPKNPGQIFFRSRLSVNSP